MPIQRRLAFSRFRVPNLDGAVATAAGNFLSVGAPRHRPNPVIARNEYTNQQKKEVKNGKKTYSSECPVSGHSQMYIFISFKFNRFSNTSTLSSGRSHQHSNSQQEQDFPGYFLSMLRRKNLTPLSGRSGCTSPDL